MIIQALLGFVALMFAASLTQSFLPLLPPPLMTLPVILIIGILLMHIIRPTVGAAWLATGGLWQNATGFWSWPSVLAAIIGAGLGIVLCRRVFTNRSMYAMMGLGTALYLTESLVKWTAPTLPAGLVFWLGLISGFALCRGLFERLKKVFLIRL